MAAASSPVRAVLWFRNDLRLLDNCLFHHPSLKRAASALCVYCLDRRQTGQSTWGSHARLGKPRAQFLAESLLALDAALEKLGSKLVVLDSAPEDVLPELVGEDGLLIFQLEDTSEEQDVEASVVKRLPKSAVVANHRGLTLHHPDDVGWQAKEDLPLPFGKFYHETCCKITPRKELPAPQRGELPLPPACFESLLQGIPVVRCDAHALAACMNISPKEMCASRSARDAPMDDFVGEGGEQAGLARLDAYCAATQGLANYHRSRNQLQGADGSSRLSPWLANGCLSPRTVYWKLRYIEKCKGFSRDQLTCVQKLIFQLCWRDYFRFYCTAFGKKVFFVRGPAQRWRPWRRDAEVEERWKAGRTGVPLVDALMRQLAQTGYITNRGRYIVACYLVHYLGIDWRVGADWFESLLVDHDVCINYGEWASMANVAVDLGPRYPLGLKGRGPTGGRRPGENGGGGDPWAKGAMVGDAVFDPWEQAENYDRSESFVRKWLPELQDVPKGQAHRPSTPVRGIYPAPLAASPDALRPEMPGKLEELPAASAVGGRAQRHMHATSSQQSARQPKQPHRQQQLQQQQQQQEQQDQELVQEQPQPQSRRWKGRSSWSEPDARRAGPIGSGGGGHAGHTSKVSQHGKRHNNARRWAPVGAGSSYYSDAAYGG